MAVRIVYAPVEPGPWRLRMGLRPLDPADWLEVDRARAEQLEIKYRLLETAHERVVAALEGTEADSRVLLDLVVSNLEARTPALVTPTPAGGSAVVEASTGRVVDLGQLHPVDAAGRLVQEDLCVMVRDQDRWVLGAASVCFPSRWSLTEKIGRDLAAIHGPVPGYEERLAGPTAGFFDRLRGDRPVWRLNWTILDSPDLHQPGGRSGPSEGPGEAGDLWFRVERQTLRRLTGTAVAFTIRTYVHRLADLVSQHPAAAAALGSVLSDLPSDVARYKGWEFIAPAVLEWCRSGLSGAGG